MGALATLQSELERELREAERSGDQLMQATMRVYCGILWLARGDIQGAEQNLSVPRTSSDGHFTLVHFFELVAQSELELYRGQVHPSPEHILARFVPLERSLLLRVRLVRATALWLKGRLLLASGSSRDLSRRLREVKRAAHGLRGLDAPFASAWGALLLAAAASARGSRDEAVTLLRDAERSADQFGMRLIGAAARYRLGESLGQSEGAGLRALAVEQLRAAPVADPEAFMRVLAPVACVRSEPRLLRAELL
jgi:hypothetical protein